MSILPAPSPSALAGLGAPLVAQLATARREPAPSPRALAPCDDCRAPAGVACGPACPSRVEPPEAP